MKKFKQSVKCDINLDRDRIEDNLDIEVSDTVFLLEEVAKNPQNFPDTVLKDLVDSIHDFNRSLRADTWPYR